VDQALNLVTRVSDASYASRSSDASTDLDAMEVMDDLDVATVLPLICPRKIATHTGGPSDSTGYR
jgi:hypothetical protein